MKLGRYIIGILSGLTFGMLFAPKRGKHLRDEIIKSGKESGQDALAALFNAFKEAGMDAVEEMKKLSDSEQVQSALNMSKEKMHEYLSGLGESSYDLAQKAHNKIEEWGTSLVEAPAIVKKTVSKKKKAVARVAKAKVGKLTKKGNLKRRISLKK